MARILMCPPDYFRQDYAINPWMENNTSAVVPAEAREQWMRLYNAITEQAQVQLIEPQQPCADMVFAADAGVVSDGVAVLSNYRYPERQEEAAFYRQWFEINGYDVRPLPEGVFLEGGDVYLDPVEPRLWAGYGFRSTVEAHRLAGQHLEREVVSLELSDPRFYHLDTCCSFLSGGYVMYYPSALSGSALALIESRMPAKKRIVVDADDALQFACNAVNIDDVVFANSVSERLGSQLAAAGFRIVETPLAQFLNVGGSARCLTLKV